ncbi:MAG TPA: type II secretion system protein [Gemmatimonadales bacterium]|nr:type II secretion system protein [Gemmatimonadales bacterium]
MSRPISRGGFTLIETLVVIVMISIILTIGFPSLNRARVKSDIRSARNQAVALYYTARSSAVMTGRVTTLTFNGNRAVITATPRLSPSVGSTADTIGNVENLGVVYGVTISASPGNAVTVDPRGLGSSVATTVYFTRNGQQDSMLVTGYGRVIR